MLNIAGIDMGLANTGLIARRYDPARGKFVKSLGLELLETKKETKAKIRRNSDDLARATELFKGVHDFLKKYNIDVVCVEMPVGSQNSRGAMAYGLSIGIIASIEQPLIQVLPGDVKMACGVKNATKQQMIDWATENFTKFNWLKQGKRFVQKNEHLADALGATVAGTKYNDFKLLTAGR